jgi:hypothetical protein
MTTKSDRWFDKVQEKAPEYPDHTCPAIDNAKEVIEGLRDANINLREGLWFWRDQVKELLPLVPADKRKKYLKNLGV